RAAGYGRRGRGWLEPAGAARAPVIPAPIARIGWNNPNAGGSRHGRPSRPARPRALVVRTAITPAIGAVPSADGSRRGWQLALRAARAEVVDRLHRLAKLGQPLLGMLADQPYAPRQRFGPRAGNARVDQRVEHLPLRLAQSRHDRDGQRRENLLGVTQPDTPCDFALIAVFRLAGDLHAGLARLLPEPGDPPGHRGRPLGVVGELVLQCGQLPDHDDFLAVHADLRRAGEPVVRQPPGEPGRRVVGRRSFRLLTPAARAFPPVPHEPLSYEVPIHRNS